MRKFSISTVSGKRITFPDFGSLTMARFLESKTINPGLSKLSANTETENPGATSESFSVFVVLYATATITTIATKKINLVFIDVFGISRSSDQFQAQTCRAFSLAEDT